MEGGAARVEALAVRAGVVLGVAGGAAVGLRVDSRVLRTGDTLTEAGVGEGCVAEVWMGEAGGMPECINQNNSGAPIMARVDGEVAAGGGDSDAALGLGFLAMAAGAKLVRDFGSRQNPTAGQVTPCIYKVVYYVSG
jgi:hypothetical protein